MKTYVPWPAGRFGAVILPVSHPERPLGLPQTPPAAEPDDPLNDGLAQGEDDGDREWEQRHPGTGWCSAQPAEK